MKTNDIKKGMRIKLRNGWYGTMLDNMRGNARMVDVEGFVRECGSVYAWDILFVLMPDGRWRLVEHTPKQLEMMRTVGAMFS